MPINLDRLIALRPFLYHITDRANTSALSTLMRLQPAADLLRHANRADLLRTRRLETLTVAVGGQSIVLKDQAPLIERNLELTDDWDFGDFVAFLNEHVFFWPGRETGPINQGDRLLGRYEAEGPLVLRVPTAALIAANPDATMLYSAFNSGAPRMQRGRRVSRGLGVFSTAAEFDRRESEVVEIVFRSPVQLPVATEFWEGHRWNAFSPTYGW